MNSASFNPIFVGGAGRSGTTLLRAMLASHPALTGTNEFKLLPSIVDLRRMFDGYREVTDAYSLQGDYLDTLFADLVRGLFTPYIDRAEGLRLIEKTPHNVMAADVLARFFPASRHIHIVRDGRDVACSLVTMDWRGADGQKLWYTQSIEAAAEYWRQVVESALAQADVVGKEQCRRVHYESLIREPRQRMQSLLDWLREPWDEAVLDEARRKGMMNAEISESSSVQVGEAINHRAVGRWKKEMSAPDRETFHRVAGPLLQSLGYASDGAWV